MTTRLVYTRNDLLRLRDSNLPLLRSIRRDLWFNKLLIKQPRGPGDTSRISNSITGNFKIPVRITSTSRRKHHFPRVSNTYLVPVPRQSNEKSKTLTLPTIFLTNVRSVRNKIDELHERIKKVNPGVAVITESWLDACIPNDYLSVPDFDIFRKDRLSLGGGVLVFCKTIYGAELCHCLKFSRDNTCNSDILCILLKPHTLLIVIYHPYWGHSACNAEVIDFLVDVVAHSRLVHATKSVIVCGDFNGLSDEIPAINALLNTESLFSFPTREGSQLDHVLTDCKSAFQEAYSSAPIGRSDHHVIVCPTMKMFHSKVLKIEIRSKTPVHCAKFAAALSCAPFLSQVKAETDASAAVELFTKDLYNIYNENFPLRCVKLRTDDKPWIKPSLKLLINKRDRAFHNGNNAKYIRLRESVILHTKKLKRDFLTSTSGSNRSRSEWNAINKLLNRKHFARIDVNPGQLSSIFSSVYVTPSHNFNIDESILPSHPMHISSSDVNSVLHGMKKSSPGPDQIPSWVLRDNSDTLSQIVTHICHLSFSSGVVPSNLKKAYITPIPKCQRPTLSDYRPISILPCLSKVIEKLVHKKWLSPLSSKLGPEQFAFIPRLGQGTTCALTYIMHQILSFLDNPGAVRLVSIDMKKAFDRIPHHVILESLISKGATKELVTWIKSYLTGRKQSVKINNKFSNWIEAKSGVPQGSVLAPLLFAFTIDNLEPKHTNSMIIKFADDVCLLHFIRNCSDDHLQDELNHISSWCSSNGLALNASKTKVMNFQTKNSLIFTPIYDPATNVFIEALHSIKLLGIIIDDRFTWKEHVNQILSKLRKRVYFLHALRQANASTTILSRVYEALVRSVMTYAFPAWCNVSATRFRSLLQFEKRLKKVFRFHTDTTLEECCKTMCSRLAIKAYDKNHPLNAIYDVSASRYSSRLGTSHRKIRSRTERFRLSFIKFA